jgi:hypothetical protein
MTFKRDLFLSKTGIAKKIDGELSSESSAKANKCPIATWLIDKWRRFGILLAYPGAIEYE